MPSKDFWRLHRKYHIYHEAGMLISCLLVYVYVTYGYGRWKSKTRNDCGKKTATALSVVQRIPLLLLCFVGTPPPALPQPAPAIQPLMPHLGLDTLATMAMVTKLNY